MNAPEDTLMQMTTDRTTRELDHRVTDGLEVKLLWNSLTDRVSVAMEDERTGEFFAFDVDPGDALIARPSTRTSRRGRAPAIPMGWPRW